MSVLSVWNDNFFSQLTFNRSRDMSSNFRQKFIIPLFGYITTHLHVVVISPTTSTSVGSNLIEISPSEKTGMTFCHFCLWKWRYLGKFRNTIVMVTNFHLFSEVIVIFLTIAQCLFTVKEPRQETRTCLFYFIFNWTSNIF
jgi:hypothetical protein